MYIWPDECLYGQMRAERAQMYLNYILVHNKLVVWDYEVQQSQPQEIK